jgi:cell division protein FtsB
MSTLQRSGVSIVLLGLFVLAGGLLIGFIRMAWQEHQINRQIEQQQAENAALAEQNQKLKGEAEFAESDVAVEIKARERLGMAREGDTVLLPTVVVPPTPTPTAPPAATGPDSAAAPSGDSTVVHSNPVRWLQALFPGPEAMP